jgi:hypothetical protein
MIMTNTSSKDHWNEVYRVKNLEKLGWYEENPEQSLRLIEKCGLGCDDPLVDVGTGETTLIEHLIRMGFRKIIAVDISEVALEKLKARLGKENASHVTWIVDDLTGPAHLQQLKDIALWHDRAVPAFPGRGKAPAHLLSDFKACHKAGRVCDYFRLLTQGFNDVQRAECEEL